MQRHILIAENDSSTSRQLKELLEADSHVQVDTARDVREALAALKDNNYSILLAELALPGGGMELIEELRKRSVPATVIVMTSNGSVDDAVQAMRLGAYDFLAKPIDRQHLRLVVKRVLRERL